MKVNRSRGGRGGGVDAGCAAGVDDGCAGRADIAGDVVEDCDCAAIMRASVAGMGDCGGGVDVVGCGCCAVDGRVPAAMSCASMIGSDGVDVVQVGECGGTESCCRIVRFVLREGRGRAEPGGRVVGVVLGDDGGSLGGAVVCGVRSEGGGAGCALCGVDANVRDRFVVGVCRGVGSGSSGVRRGSAVVACGGCVAVDMVGGGGRVCGVVVGILAGGGRGDGESELRRFVVVMGGRGGDAAEVVGGCCAVRVVCGCVVVCCGCDVCVVLGGEGVLSEVVVVAGCRCNCCCVVRVVCGMVVCCGACAAVDEESVLLEVVVVVSGGRDDGGGVNGACGVGADVCCGPAVDGGCGVCVVLGGRGIGENRPRRVAVGVRSAAAVDEERAAA